MHINLSETPENSCHWKLCSELAATGADDDDDVDDAADKVTTTCPETGGGKADEGETGMLLVLILRLPAAITQMIIIIKSTRKNLLSLSLLSSLRLGARKYATKKEEEKN